MENQNSLILLFLRVYVNGKLTRFQRVIIGSTPITRIYTFTLNTYILIFYLILYLFLY